MSGGTKRAASKNRRRPASRAPDTKPQSRQRAAEANAATAADKVPRKAVPIAETVELPGVRPAAFKLVERALESYFLYRSSRKIGTARVEANGKWTARFEDSDGEWTAGAESAAELLRSVGTFLLAKDARKLAERPVEVANPELSTKGRRTPEERLSLAFAERLRKGRIANLDEMLKRLSRGIGPA